jgi:hypothetical protein
MVVWGLALLRDPVVRYTRLDGSAENRSPAYMSQYPTRQAAVSLTRSLIATIVLNSELIQSTKPSSTTPLAPYSPPRSSMPRFCPQHLKSLPSI